LSNQQWPQQLKPNSLLETRADSECVKSAIDNQLSRLEIIAPRQLVYSYREKGSTPLMDEYESLRALVKSVLASLEDEDVESFNAELFVWEDHPKYLILELDTVVFFSGVMRPMWDRSHHLINKNTDKLEGRLLIDDLEEFTNAKLKDIRKLLYAIPSNAGIGLIPDVPNVAYATECDVPFVLPWSVAKPYLTNFGKQLMKEFRIKYEY
jgi:hypothetical protein